MRHTNVCETRSISKTNCLVFRLFLNVLILIISFISYVNYVTQIEKIPPVAAQRDGRNASKHWRTASHFWSLIMDNLYILHKGSTSSPTQLHRRILATSSNHLRHFKSLKAPSRHPPWNSPDNKKLLKLLLYNLTIFYPTIQQPLLHTLNSTSKVRALP